MFIAYYAGCWFIDKLILFKTGFINRLFILRKQVWEGGKRGWSILQASKIEKKII